MPRIDQAIAPHKFEVVRDLLGTILADELTSQAALQTDPVIKKNLEELKVVSERFRPFNEQELPALDIYLFSAEFDNKDQSCARNTAIYHLDIYSEGTADDDDDGDKKSAIKAHSIAGIIRGILEHNEYIYLTTEDLPGPQRFIQRTLLRSIKRMEEEFTRDAGNTIMFRIMYEVVMSEVVGTIDGQPLQLHTTEVRIDETDLGYEYIYNPNP